MFSIYLLAPLLAWGIAGSLKFLINSIRLKKPAYHLIGYGGLPSTHTAIVSSITTLIALKKGLNHPSFGIAFTLALIVIIDANGLRQYIGDHAHVLNKLTGKRQLYERIGHSLLEIGAGLMVGMFVGSGLVLLQSFEITFR